MTCIAALGVAAALSLAGPANAADTSGAAKQACGCLQPVYAMMPQLQAEVMKAAQSGDQNAMQSFQGQMNKVGQSMDACMRQVEANHPGIRGNPTLENEVEQKMERICPRPRLLGGKG